MCEAICHPVKELRRISFCTLELGLLHEGDVRRLSAQEVASLRRLAESKAQRPRRGESRPQGRRDWEGGPPRAGFNRSGPSRGDGGGSRGGSSRGGGPSRGGGGRGGRGR